MILLAREAILNPNKGGNPNPSMGVISEIGTVITLVNGILSFPPWEAFVYYLLLTIN